MIQKILLRRGTTEQWAASNPILSFGEPCVEFRSDGTSIFKIGDGVHRYLSLPEISGGSGADVSWENITGKPNSFPPSGHNHQASDIVTDPNDRFVTDAQIDSWNNKSNFSGSYNDLMDKPIIEDAIIPYHKNTLYSSGSFIYVSRPDNVTLMGLAKIDFRSNNVKVTEWEAFMQDVSDNRMSLVGIPLDWDDTIW